MSRDYHDLAIESGDSPSGAHRHNGDGERPTFDFADSFPRGATDASSAGDEPVAVNASAATRIRMKEAELSRRFNVRFSKSGENAICRDDAPDPQKCIAIVTKAPTLRQLYGIEVGLQSSRPADKTASGGPLEFYFLRTLQNPSRGSIATYRPESANGRAGIYFDPGVLNANLPVLERDICSTDNIATSIESTIEHELAHNSEHNYAQYLQSHKELEGYESKLGWKLVDRQRGKEKEEVWILQGKDGAYYRFADNQKASGTKWLRCNEAGDPVNQNGKPVATDDLAESVDGSEVKQRAVVTPATNYFPDPDEMLAEALTLFRSGGSRRAFLFKDDPQLYSVAKQFDQDELNRVYGDSEGKPTFLRAYDGSIVPNTLAESAEIDRLERDQRLVDNAAAACPADGEPQK